MDYVYRFRSLRFMAKFFWLDLLVHSRANHMHDDALLLIVLVSAFWKLGCPPATLHSLVATNKDISRANNGFNETVEQVCDGQYTTQPWEGRRESQQLQGGSKRNPRRY